MYADLHVHTYFSDSTRSPEELSAAAASCGIGLIACCDHDTVAAYPRLRPACAAHGLRLMQGVELTARWRELQLHILGLGFDPEHAAIRAALAHNQAEYARFDESLIANLARDFPHISHADYAAFTYPPEVGCWRNTNYCIARGLIPDIAGHADLYRKYAGYQMQFVSLDIACAAIADAGGVPILAHPVNWWADAPDELEAALPALMDAGVRGIECRYPGQSPALTNRCLELCRKHHLRITAGSDDHGEFNRFIDGVEFALGQIMVDESQLDLRGLI